MQDVKCSGGFISGAAGITEPIAIIAFVRMI